MPIKDPQKNREYKKNWIANKRKQQKGDVEPINNFVVEPTKITDHIAKHDKDMAEWKKFSQNIDNSIFCKSYFLKIDKEGWNICNKCSGKLFPWDAEIPAIKKVLESHKHEN